MRMNTPVTDHEVEMPEGQILVSRTDPDSNIVFANQPFIDISGFSTAELINQPHNLVRHPDMPKEAFANLWDTVKAGRPWDGLVKNRRKDGGFYWVNANVTPTIENGQTTGYISIRTRPSREAVATAERAYADMRAGKSAVSLSDGELRKTGLGAGIVSAAKSITGRLAFAFVVTIALTLGAATVTLSGMSDSNTALKSVYEDRTVPAGQIATINDLMHTNFALVRDMADDIEAGAATEVAKDISALQANRDRITKVWAEYMATYLTEEEKGLATSFIATRTKFVKEGLEPGVALAQKGDVAALRKHARETMAPIFADARKGGLALIALQERVAKELADEAAEDFKLHMSLSAGLIILSTLASTGFGFWLLASIRRPMREMEHHFDAIARADFKQPIPLPAAREFHPITRLLRSMRARLSYTIEERFERDRVAAVERRASVQAMANSVEAQTREAVENVARQTSEMANQARDMIASADRVSSNAVSVASAAEQALANAQAVSAASEQLTASITEIAGQVAQASNTAQRAVEGGERAQQRIRSLSESAARIGDVVQLISSIASQTNLLALNATIEAARAGDAGKGFAVVASEVKNLATQTSRSTEEISRQIAEIQATTAAVVEAVGDIGDRITELAQVSVAVAAAVEEQASATQEIARAVTQTGEAAQEVSVRIAEVSADATLTGTQATLVRTGTHSIADVIAALDANIIRAIRTATDDADRRLQQRHTIDRPCALAVGGVRREARLRDISRGGARIDGLRDTQIGARCTLFADSLGPDCRTDATAMDFDEMGSMCIQFVEGTISPALTAALDRLEHKTPAKAA